MKKILCALLALIMVVGSMAFTAFAEESSGDASTTEDTTSEPNTTEDPSEGDSSVDDSTSTEDSSGDDSSEPAVYRTISFFVTGGDVSISCLGDYETDINGNEISFRIPEGEIVTFTISPMEEGYVVSKISEGNYTVDLSKGTVSLTVNRNVNIDVTVTEADTVTVSLNMDDNEKGSVSYDGIGDDNKRFAVGSVIELAIDPFAGYGVQKITVNGDELDGVPYDGGTVSVTVAGSDDDAGVMDIEVVFGAIVTVYVTCEEGEFTALGFEDKVKFDDNAGVYSFDAPAGRTVNFTVDPETGRQIKEIRVNEDSVTFRRNSFAVSIPTTGVANIFIEFEDADDEGPHTVTVIVVGGDNGKVLYSGEEVGEEIENVRHGRQLTLTAEPDEGYTVTVTVDGDECNVKANGDFITPAVEDDMVIHVEFSKIEDESSEEPSEDESSDDNSGDVQLEYWTAADLPVYDFSTVVTVDISDRSKIGREGLVLLNEFLKDKSHSLTIEVPGSYRWTIPGGSSFNTSNLPMSGIDFAVEINTGEYANRITTKLEEIANANNLRSTQICVIERASDAALPEGTMLTVNVRKYDSGTSVGDFFQWLKYDPDVDKNGGSPLTDAGGILYAVDGDGNVTVTNYADAVYGVLSRYIGDISTVTVRYNRNECILGNMDNDTSDENGNSTNVISWENGEDFTLTITPKDGYVFDTLVLSDTTKLKLQIFDSNGEEITDSGVKGKSGKVKVLIKGFSENCTITVNMSATQPAAPQQEPDSAVAWEIIILIAVIAITMIGGGVFFVIKWRQNGDDDDDDEFEDFDGDEQ